MNHSPLNFEKKIVIILPFSPNTSPNTIVEKSYRRTKFRSNLAKIIKKSHSAKDQSPLSRNLLPLIENKFKINSEPYKQQPIKTPSPTKKIFLFSTNKKDRNFEIFDFSNENFERNKAKNRIKYKILPKKIQNTGFQTQLNTMKNNLKQSFLPVKNINFYDRQLEDYLNSTYKPIQFSLRSKSEYRPFTRTK